jgi:hypothetical protein
MVPQQTFASVIGDPNNFNSKDFRDVTEPLVTANKAPFENTNQAADAWQKFGLTPSLVDKNRAETGMFKAESNFKNKTLGAEIAQLMGNANRGNAGADLERAQTDSNPMTILNNFRKNHQISETDYNASQMSLMRNGDVPDDVTIFDKGINANEVRGTRDKDGNVRYYNPRTKKLLVAGQDYGTVKQKPKKASGPNMPPGL